MISYGRQQITQADIDAVLQVLQGDFLTQGPAVPAFEEAVCRSVKSQHAVAANSATSALHIACLALGIGAGDLVWTSAISFVASANCALYCGASVDFVDIDPSTFNMSAGKLEEKLILAEQNGELPKAVIPVHMCGQSCEMREIKRLAEKYGFAIIEDASHAIGGKYFQSNVGSCKYSDITVFSFHPVKIITTGEGGIATTNCERLAQRMKLFRSHGVTRDDQLMRLPSSEPWYYEQLELGFNYRMTDIQAALGVSQLERLDDVIDCRNKISERYREYMAGLPLDLPKVHDGITSSWHLYVVRIRLDEIKRSREEVVRSLLARGVGVNVHYIPIFSHPYYQELGFSSVDFPEASAYYKRCLTLPLHPGLSREDEQYIAQSLHSVLLEA